MKRRSIALLLAVALAAVPTLSTSAPPSCRVPLAAAEVENLAVQEPFPGEMPKEEELPASADPSAVASGGYMSDVKAGTVEPFGVEIVEPPGCPEISGQ